MDRAPQDQGGRSRSRVHFETKITVEAGGESHVYQRTHDLSMNGVFVKTVKPLPLGTRGRFALTLSAGMRQEIIKGVCEVARVVPLDDGLSESEHGPGMGLKFIELEPESSRMLYMVIRHNQPE